MGQVRIIGGKWRGRKLLVLNSSGLRPTTNRIREMLFNWLAQYILNARCLDCFAGSGALGLEALSRFAISATLLEIEYHVAQQLKKSLVMLNTTDAKVINVNTLFFLKQSSSIPYNIVFVDPPFYKGLLQETLILLEKNEWLDDHAFIYIEKKAKYERITVPMSWTLYRKKIIRNISCCLYYRNIK